MSPPTGSRPIPATPGTPLRLQSGFTLVELIMVIVILGIVGGIMAVFMRSPIDAYLATTRRAGLADAADGALRRMSRDLHKSLPNSIQVTANSQCIDFIPTKTGGRYRVDGTAAGLDFTTTDSNFNMLGANPTAADQAIQVGDWVAVYNLGITGADAYAGDNTAQVTAVSAATVIAPNPAETAITITPKQFPLESPSSRFQVISGTERVVSYACNLSSGTLLRATNTGSFTKNCQSDGTVSASASVRVSVLAQKVTKCTFLYDANSQSNALLGLQLQMTDSGETVSLQSQMHVDNTP